MLLGREAEQRVVDELLQKARGGRSAVLAVRGESGIGKTSLLGYAECNAGDIDDPHIILVFEAGNANGVLFIAMRYVPGGDAGSMSVPSSGTTWPEEADFAGIRGVLRWRALSAAEWIRHGLVVAAYSVTLSSYGGLRGGEAAADRADPGY